MASSIGNSNINPHKYNNSNKNNMNETKSDEEKSVLFPENINTLNQRNNNFPGSNWSTVPQYGFTEIKICLDIHGQQQEVSLYIPTKPYSHSELRDSFQHWFGNLPESIQFFNSNGVLINSQSNNIHPSQVGIFKIYPRYIEDKAQFIEIIESIGLDNQRNEGSVMPSAIIRTQHIEQQCIIEITITWTVQDERHEARVGIPFKGGDLITTQEFFETISSALKVDEANSNGCKIETGDKGDIYGTVIRSGKLIGFWPEHVTGLSDAIQVVFYCLNIDTYVNKGDEAIIKSMEHFEYFEKYIEEHKVEKYRTDKYKTYKKIVYINNSSTTEVDVNLNTTVGDLLASLRQRLNKDVALIINETEIKPNTNISTLSLNEKWIILTEPQENIAQINGRINFTPPWFKKVVVTCEFHLIKLHVKPNTSIAELAQFLQTNYHIISKQNPKEYYLVRYISFSIEKPIKNNDELVITDIEFTGSIVINYKKNSDSIPTEINSNAFTIIHSNKNDLLITEQKESESKVYVVNKQNNEQTTANPYQHGWKAQVPVQYSLRPQFTSNLPTTFDQALNSDIPPEITNFNISRLDGMRRIGHTCYITVFFIQALNDKELLKILWIGEDILPTCTTHIKNLVKFAIRSFVIAVFLNNDNQNAVEKWVYLLNLLIKKLKIDTYEFNSIYEFSELMLQTSSKSNLIEYHAMAPTYVEAYNTKSYLEKMKENGVNSLVLHVNDNTHFVNLIFNNGKWYIFDNSYGRSYEWNTSVQHELESQGRFIIMMTSSPTPQIFIRDEYKKQINNEEKSETHISTTAENKPGIENNMIVPNLIPIKVQINFKGKHECIIDFAHTNELINSAFIKTYLEGKLGAELEDAMLITIRKDSNNEEEINFFEDTEFNISKISKIRIGTIKSKEPQDREKFCKKITELKQTK